MGRRGYNSSGILEYFYNGFGIPDGNYSQEAMVNNPDLTEHLLRGEFFTLGRHYVVGSAMMEVKPLWQLTTNLLVNVDDGSALAQLVSACDFKQDWGLLAAVNRPGGPMGALISALSVSSSVRV
jgi:hypothetical protein